MFDLLHFLDHFVLSISKVTFEKMFVFVELLDCEFCLVGFEVEVVIFFEM